MTIFNSGGVSLGGYSDPGIGTLYANNVYVGFTTITAAAGTTILTNASAGWQNVVGTTTQTIRLPVATTLYKGLTFTITSSSTGNVTITDSASATVDTIITGGTAVMVLTDNTTSAGTWKAYSYIPSSYDFNSTSASFGNASITNAVWNGTTIASGYGGTGLTTFTAANNAIYSTSASALAAGTLPAAAGGTSFATYATGDIIYASATNTLSKLAAGTNGYVLTLAAGVPSWAAASSGVTVTNDTSTATSLYPTFTSATSGSISGVSVTSTKFTFVPSTGTLTSPQLSASNGLVVNSKTVAVSYSIPSGSSAMSTGPITVNSGIAVTVPSGSRWVVI